MKKVKIIRHSDETMFTKNVEDFINNKGIEVFEIHYAETEEAYSCMVIYRKKESWEMNSNES